MISVYLLLDKAVLVDYAIIFQIITAISVPAVSWLIVTVINQGKEIVALKTLIDSQHEATKAACDTCRNNFDRRINDGTKENDRRFEGIEKSLALIDQKLDRLISKA